jgi:MFS family permease
VANLIVDAPRRAVDAFAVASSASTAPRTMSTCGDWLDLRTGSVEIEPETRAAPRGFWLVAGIFAIVQIGGTLPIPLYVLWKTKFGFGTATLTLIFAVYALGTLLSLLLLSPLSDQLGRRRALVAALALAVLSFGAFLLADSVGVLLIARFVSGMASGMVAASATAALSELEPHARARRASLTATAANLGGLGLGPLIAGFIAQDGHDPTKLVFWVYLALLVPAVLAVWLVTETIEHAGPVAWRPRGLALPAGARTEFALVASVGFCAYTLFGLFSSLVPSFLGSSLHEHNHAIAGAIAAAIFLIAVIAQLVLHRMSPPAALTAGVLTLLIGLALIELGLWSDSLAVFLVGTFAGGVAAGLAFMGGIATVNQIAAPEHRASVVAAFLTCAFAGLAIPAVVVGLASESLGTDDATLYCAIVIAALALVALAALRRSEQGRTRAASALVRPRGR